MSEILVWPLIAALVLTGIHAYFGLHVLARGVVFVDLSLAQVAALGITVAILAGHPVQSEAAYWYGLVFAAGGAVLFAVARRHEAAMQQEAVIGMVYAVSASLAVLALDRAPQGAEHVKQLLVGSILTVTPHETAMLAALYAAIGFAHWLLRRPLLEASFNPLLAAALRRRIFLWDVVFYGSFALVVTSSVRVAGVLLVFSYLIVPAALAALFADTVPRRLLVAWALGVVVTAAGLAASWIWDFPTGPAIVAAFGVAAALVALGFGFRRFIKAMRTGKLPGLTAARILSLAIALAGLLLASFPRMDQPWLDALERVLPVLHEAFLTPEEREVRAESLASIERDTKELARLRALELNVRWGATKMDAEKQDRLRQFLAGRAEIVAGEQLVLRDLHARAREKQRYALGIPLILVGVAAFTVLSRRRRRE